MKLGKSLLLGALILVIGGLAALPWLAPSVPTRPLTEADRAGGSGRAFKLSAGTTYAELAGPAQGAPIVFVHGFSTPNYIWDRNFPEVVKAGYRALRYDLFGRGLSDRPEVDYNADLFDRQLADLIAASGLKAPVTLIGVSMGGAISVEFAARHPELVKALVLVDPAGFPLDLPLSVRIMQLPGVGEYLMKVAGLAAMRSGMASNFHDPAPLAEFARKFEPQMAFEGYLAGQLSTLRHMNLQALQPSYEAVGRSGKPVLLVFGRQDAVIPFAHAALISAAVPQATLLTVDPAGHVPNYERPEVVNPALLAFLAQHAK